MVSITINKVEVGVINTLPLDRYHGRGNKYPYHDLYDDTLNLILLNILKGY
nr:MAG TPA: hypothetical protein [Bacteriophage sp.]